MMEEKDDWLREYINVGSLREPIYLELCLLRGRETGIFKIVVDDHDWEQSPWSMTYELWLPPSTSQEEAERELEELKLTFVSFNEDLKKEGGVCPSTIDLARKAKKEGWSLVAYDHIDLCRQEL